MAAATLKQRLNRLEREVATLKEQLDPSQKRANSWIDELFGVFREDPTFKASMKLGRQYSASLDIKSKKRKAL